MQPSKAWVFEGDISQFFDCIDHSFLLGRLEYFPGLNLINKWLKAGIFLDSVFYETDEGTPSRERTLSAPCEHLFAWFTGGNRNQ